MAGQSNSDNSFDGSAMVETLKSTLPILSWLPSYKKAWFGRDLLAACAHAAYSVPEALVNSALAGLAPQHGLYCFLLGGFAYSFFTTSRQAAVAASAAISIMVGTSLGALGIEDPARYAQLAAATAVLVGIISCAAWFLRLSDIVSFISETILIGFRVGAALVIMSSQLPKMLGVETSGGNFFARMYHVFQNVADTNFVVLVVGGGALVLMLAGRKMVGKGVAPLAVVMLSIVLMSFTNLSEYGVKVAGEIPEGLPSFVVPKVSLADLGEIIPIAFGCFLLAYVEGISMIRTLGSKYHYPIDMRQEFLAAGAANLTVGLAQGFPVAVGLSQTAINDQAGAKTALSGILACLICGVGLLFFTGVFRNLPESVLAAMVMVAAKDLADLREFNHLKRVSKHEFVVALATLFSVLLLGILKGVLVAAVISLLMLVHRAARPTVSVLGRIPGTDQFGGMDRHPENETLPNVLACRVEGDLLYFNVENIFEEIMKQTLAREEPPELVVFDLSTSNHVDLAGARMVRHLHQELTAQGVELKWVGAHGDVRDLLRRDGVEELVGRIDRRLGLDTIMTRREDESDEPRVLGH